MSFQERLQRSLSDYLARPTSVRPQLGDVIKDIDKKLPETVIFGGMIREFALGNARRFVSDIDLVSLAGQSEIYNAIQSYAPTKNKFGGYRFILKKQRFDIWSLHDTWAFRHGHVSGSTFKDLLKTTFFNVDAGCYDIHQKNIHLLDGYEACIRDRILDINLLQNPNPRAMAKKALDLVLNRKLGMTMTLAKFVAENLNSEYSSWLEKQLLARIINFITRDKPGIFRFNPQGELDP